MRKKTVGIRELRKGLRQAGTLERLLANGRLRAARHDLAELGYPDSRLTKMTLTEALVEKRGEEGAR